MNFESEISSQTEYSTHKKKQQITFLDCYAHVWNRPDSAAGTLVGFACKNTGEHSKFFPMPMFTLQ